MNQAQAAQIVRQAWQNAVGRAPTELERTYAQAIAWLENQYGRAGQFGQLAANGQFNWGSLHARTSPPNCGPGAAAGTDVRPVCFLVFPDDVSAATVFIRNLTTKWPTIPAMAGTPEDVARAMRKPPAYYEGPPGTEDQKIAYYAGAIRNAIAAIGRGTPVPPIPSSSASPSSSSHALFWLAVLGGSAYAVHYLYGGKTVRALGQKVTIP